MPTSITVAPGLIQSPRTISGLPIAATSRSARRHTAGRSRVLECAMVTVAFSASSKLRHRLADDVGAADHHGFEAGERRHARSWPACTQPSGVQGTSAGRPEASRPALTGWKPSTSLAGSMASSTALRVDLLGQRQLHQDAVHGRIGVELLHQRQQFGLADAVRQAVIERAHAGLDRDLGLAADIGLARRIVAGQHHRETGRDAVLRREALHLGRDLGAQLRRDGLAVDDGAVMAYC